MLVKVTDSLFIEKFKVTEDNVGIFEILLDSNNQFFSTWYPDRYMDVMDEFGISYELKDEE